MMTSFAWKRKLGQDVCKQTVAKFTEGAYEENHDQNANDDVFFRKRTTSAALEDSIAKSRRLFEEGSKLAENERNWEAIKKFDEAITLTPTNEKLHEMKAQSLLQLNELYPAVQAAEHAVKLNPVWWVGYQTLGRAHLGLGEVKRAVVCFSKAVHINPAEREIWDEDLAWARSLLDKFKALQSAKIQLPTTENITTDSVIIQELEQSYSEEEDLEELAVKRYEGAVREERVETDTSEDSTRLNSDWVRMRVRK